ncbi:hypothetical protein ACFQ3S_00075 [Mucilaginibacter terrae]|uniref:hypothetical protein n=1 Tax=Mucilaginibacter terrae TaxID=1955052 RepID=UPI003640E494
MEIDIEHKEWPEDDSWRQKLPPGNPFGVPAGYFDDLSERIISGVHLEELIQADALSGFTVPENYFTELSNNIQSRIVIEEALASETEGFTVPENYFEQLSSNLQSRIVIEEALANEAGNFTVPQGYFEELSSNIQSRVAIEEALANEAESFTVPEGYFEDLAANIQGRVALEEAINAKHNIFEVPEGYFDQLQQNILSQTAEQEAKVVQMPSRGGVVRKLISTAAFKYASAACVAIIVGVAIYVNQAPAGSNHSYLHKELADISTNDLRTYLESQSDATQTERKVIADDVQLDNESLRDALQDYVDAQ